MKTKYCQLEDWKNKDFIHLIESIKNTKFHLDIVGEGSQKIFDEDSLSK